MELIEMGEWTRQSRGLNRSDQVDKGALNRVSEDGNACVLVDGVSDILTNECMHFHAIVALNPTTRAHNTKPDYHSTTAASFIFCSTV